MGWERIKKGENCSPLATNKWGGGGGGLGGGGTGGSGGVGGTEGRKERKGWGAIRGN